MQDDLNFIPTDFTEFDRYIRQGEPDQRERAQNWAIAIGLQAVDGLHVSEYLKQTALRNIEGEITIDKAHKLINQYYTSAQNRKDNAEDTEEADRATANISRILSTRTLAFNTNGFIAMHRRIFEGVFKHAGKLRDYDITKKEWVLQNDTVSYLNYEDLRRALDYDIQKEQVYSYTNVENEELVQHITAFVAGLWQIHPFREGNTRTTAVFTIQYLRSIGFEVDNQLFADNAWYFRNALVRANYKNAKLGIDYTPVYLERFFRNLLLGEHWELKNRYLYILPPPEWRVQPQLDKDGNRIFASVQVHPTSTPQVTPQLYPTTSLVTYLNPESKFYSDNVGILELVWIVAAEKLTIKQLMEKRKLKDRKNFIDKHLEPALKERFLRRMYPDKPNHPRQKYYLTVKGNALYQEMKNIMAALNQNEHHS